MLVSPFELEYLLTPILLRVHVNITLVDTDDVQVKLKSPPIGTTLSPESTVLAIIKIAM